MKGSGIIKKAVSILLVIFIITQSFVIVPSANVQISPFYTLVSTCTSTLTISGSTATCTSVARGYIGTTTKIEINQYLEKKSGNNWVNEASWSSTINSSSGSATNTRNNLSNGTYRLRTVFTINNSETITVISSEKTKS